MIVKSYEERKIDITKQKIHLLYGENQGQIKDFIDIFFKKKFKDSIYQYDEIEILNDENIIFDTIQTKSFFEDKKLVIINRVTDKFKNIIELIKEKELSDINIILISNILEKKSKLRNLFEKDKNLVCVAFYKDTEQTLSNLVTKLCRDRKINISRQLMNLIIRRAMNNRQSLKNELDKIEAYSSNKVKLDEEKILKLTNVSENHDINTLIDNCLIKNRKKIIEIINDNNFLTEETIQIVRIYLAKAKRLLNLAYEIKKTNNIDSAIITHKPPIFWKDKEIVKNQLKIWSTDKLNELIVRISSLELLIKKNSHNSINILVDFILKETVKNSNNYS